MVEGDEREGVVKRDPEKAKAWRERSKPLARSTAPMSQRKPLKKRNPKRLAKRRAKQFGEQSEICRYMQCCVCRRYSFGRQRGRSSDLEMAIAAAHEWRERYGTDARVSDPSHLKTRGAGGTDEHVVPMCRKHHDELGGVNSGIATFQARHEIDLFAIAAAIHEVIQKGEAISAALRGTISKEPA